MACFVVGGGEAIVVSAVRAAVKRSEESRGIVDKSGRQLTDPSVEGYCWTRKLTWLMNMLWGGVALLAVEHMWHGEVVPFPPFLTAMNNPEDIPEMLHEMATVGVGMAALVTVVWLVGTVVADAVARHASDTAAKEA